MARRKATRTQRKTLLVVGEGHTEVAFLNYLKTLYCRGSGSVHVKVDNAHGKGPENVVDTALRVRRRGQYDKVAAVLDTDIPWTDLLKRLARTEEVELIGNTPCIEALFLRVMGVAPPADTEACKTAAASAITHDLLDKNTYSNWCAPARLERLCVEDEGLARLVRLYRGED